jgi:hypothetical protein
MAGNRIAGWSTLQNAMRNLADERLRAAKGTASDRDMLDSVLLGLQQVTNGLDESLQQVYERIERLHQKIDRIEKKVGSV